MAGMFYSIKEVAEKLGKTDDEVRELVKNGRLREFRDGPNLLFKINEVEALLADTAFMGAKVAEAPEVEPVAEPAAEQPTIEPAGEAEDEIILAPEEREPAKTAETGMVESDTDLAEEGVGILGETDTEYKLSDDTMAETKSGSAEAASLEEIEEDVNLDTFGSGSGLLDLSLQADDTSLGGILDEIYTSEGEEGEQAEAAGSAVEMTAEAEQMISEEPAGLPEAVAMSAYLEPEPDTTSNLFGLMLILPLVLIIYTAIVAVSAQVGIIPSVLQGIQSLIWPIMIGAMVLAGVVAGAAVVVGGSAQAGKKPKVKKLKKEKKPKKKKEKKAKKGKS